MSCGNFNYKNNTNNVGKSNGYGYNSPYQFRSQSQNNGSAIPYHARENSLPFSYGKIGKTSTPLKSVSNGAGHGYGNESIYLNSNGSNGIDTNYNLNGNGFGSGSGSGSGSTGEYRGNVSNNYRKVGSDGSLDDADAIKIKAEPRLKSPLLVRKTLNNHSPTRSGTTNTISNTYHYSYGNINDKNGRQSEFSPFNGNRDLNGSFYNTTTRARTPTRADLEDLLHDRRVKVFNEYRDTTRQYEPQIVVPPPHQFRSDEDTTDAVYATPRHKKYNYDFEFHLNLDEDRTEIGSKIPPQPPLRRTSSNAMEHYSSNNINTFGKREQLEREQYRTRDIVLPPISLRDVQRNYHTLSTTSAAAGGAATAINRQPQWSNGNYGRCEDLSTERYFDIHEQRRQHTQSMPQPQSIQQQRQTEYAQTTTYGNGNSAGYGYGYGYNSNNNNNNNNNNNIYKNHNLNNVTEPAVYRSQLDFTARPTEAAPASMPIYATTTKQVMKSSTLSAAVPATTKTTTTTMMDYHSTANMASPKAIVTPTTPLLSRPETPAFPVTPRTPFGTIQNGHSLSSRRLDHSLNSNSNCSQQYNSETVYQMSSPRSRLNSAFSVATTNAEPQEVAAHLVKFAKDSSNFWYKPNLSRDEAISFLIDASPGTFLVRDSTTYKNAYGLVLRVAQPPPNSNSTGKPDELVRHFLIEPTTRGVRLKGCPNEPVFTSLSALVYEHSINQLALPCLLRIPEEDLVPPLIEPTPAQKQLLAQGAACNVLWLYSCDTESLTGEEAIRKAIRQLYAQKPLHTPTEVHFKVSQQGITLTDNTRKKFFRKHYAADMISFCAIDPDHRLWTMPVQNPEGEKTTTSTNTNTNTKADTALKKTIFAFVARRSPSSKDNQCHVFCDLAVNQPASAIVSFANKTLPTDRQRNYIL